MGTLQSLRLASNECVLHETSFPSLSSEFNIFCFVPILFLDEEDEFIWFDHAIGLLCRMVDSHC